MYTHIYHISNRLYKNNYGIYIVSIAASTQKFVDCSFGIGPINGIHTAGIIVVIIHETKCSWQGLML